MKKIRECFHRILREKSPKFICFRFQHQRFRATGLSRFSYQIKSFERIKISFYTVDPSSVFDANPGERNKQEE